MHMEFGPPINGSEMVASSYATLWQWSNSLFAWSCISQLSVPVWRCVFYEWIFVQLHVFLLVKQAQKHHVPIYITGFVAAMAPLCLALMSPLIGYFVRATACWILWRSSLSQSFCCTASLPGSEVHTACWTLVGWWIPYSLWVYLYCSYHHINVYTCKVL